MTVGASDLSFFCAVTNFSYKTVIHAYRNVCSWPVYWCFSSDGTIARVWSYAECQWTV